MSYYQVVCVRGKVLGVRKQALNAEEPVGPVKYVSLDQARVVPVDISWKDLTPGQAGDKEEIKN